MFSWFAPVISGFCRDDSVFSPRIYLTSTGMVPQITHSVWNSMRWVPGFARSGNSHLSMATTLAPVDSREVVRCDRCLLVQFRTSNDLCRRCRASFDEEEPEVVLVPPPPQMMPINANGRGPLNLAASIRSLRLRGGLSQRQLAGR